MTCFAKNMFNPLYSAIFFYIFHGSHTNGNYLFEIVLSYLESLHLSRMRVRKFVKLNPFVSIMDMPLGDPQYEKLSVCCSAKCDEFFCNKVKSKFVNKKR